MGFAGGESPFSTGDPGMATAEPSITARLKLYERVCEYRSTAEDLLPPNILKDSLPILDWKESPGHSDALTPRDCTTSAWTPDASDHQLPQGSLHRLLKHVRPFSICSELGPPDAGPPEVHHAIGGRVHTPGTTYSEASQGRGEGVGRSETSYGLERRRSISGDSLEGGRGSRQTPLRAAEDTPAAMPPARAETSRGVAAATVGTKASYGALDPGRGVQGTEGPRGKRKMARSESRVGAAQGEPAAGAGVHSPRVARSSEGCKIGAGKRKAPRGVLEGEGSRQSSFPALSWKAARAFRRMMEQHTSRLSAAQVTESALVMPLVFEWCRDRPVASVHKGRSLCSTALSGPENRQCRWH